MEPVRPLEDAALPQPEEVAFRHTFSTEDIYHMLRHEIMILALKPGELISENEISERFNVSRTPIRSVIERLRLEGLVTVIPRKGTFVQTIDLDFAEQIIYMRIQVELGVMLYICRHPSAALFDRLEENLAQQKELIKNDGIDQSFYRLDSRFHEMCMAYCQKSKLWQVIQNMNLHYTRYRHFDYSTSSQFTPVYHTLYREHMQLLKLMQNGDEAQLNTALAVHLYGGFLRIGTRLENECKKYLSESARSVQDIITDINLFIQDAQRTAAASAQAPRRKRRTLFADI
ncbi:MAG: GntR family transcriptional regulator [Clostridiales bacterium]|nr:GntR family transcriptional regulator [Clostridiales bacterium]